MGCSLIFTTAKLLRGDKRVVLKKVSQSIAYDFFKNFIVDAKKRDWAIVIQTMAIP